MIVEAIQGSIFWGENEGNEGRGNDSHGFFKKQEVVTTSKIYSMLNFIATPNCGPCLKLLGLKREGLHYGLAA